MYEIILIGVILIAVILGIAMYTQGSMPFREVERNIAKEEVSKGILDFKTVPNINGEKYKMGKGGLLERCPCADGYECSVEDGNICKVKEGGSCSSSSDCSSNSFCFNTICTVKPDILGDDNSLYLRSTPMVLHNNRFSVPRNWWDLTDVIDICPSPKEPNLYYVLTEQGRIFRLDANPKINGKIEIAQVTKIDRMIFFDKHFYGIAKGYMYQLENEVDRVWSWGKINKLYNENISFWEIIDITTVEDLLILTTNKGIYSYEKNKNEWTGPSDFHRIVYGRNRNFYIVQHTDGKIFYHQNEKVHELDGDIIDFAVAKDNDHTIYILYGNNICYANVYDRKDGADDISIRLLGNVKRIMSHNNSLWGFSTAQRFDLSS